VENQLPRQINTSTEAHIKSLDGIRGVAVLAVLFFHFGDLSRSSSVILRTVGYIKDAGWVGVDIFFALSGFLITGILYNTRDKPDAAVNFYARRALRLFPLFYGVWVAIGLYVWLAHLPWHPGYLFYLLYAGNFTAIKYGFVGILGVAHFWSLAVEEQYYLIWPLIVWKVEGDRKIGSILACSLFLSFVIKLILIAKHVNPLVAYYLLPTHIESIAMGSALAIALRRNIERPILALSRMLLPLSGASIVLLGFVEQGLNFRNPEVQLFGYPLLGLFACCLIARSLDQSSLTAHIMTNPVLRFYGKYSYGLYVYNYLFHNLFKDYLYQPLSRHLHNQLVLNFGFLLTCYLILTLISVASFHLYESPFLQLKRKFKSTLAERSTTPDSPLEATENRAVLAARGATPTF
jgi:peptidoglycan/LPS O-acetylase OafA/YrhL